MIMETVIQRVCHRPSLSRSHPHHHQPYCSHPHHHQPYCSHPHHHQPYCSHPHHHQPYCSHPHHHQPYCSHPHHHQPHQILVGLLHFVPLYSEVFLIVIQWKCLYHPL